MIKDILSLKNQFFHDINYFLLNQEYICGKRITGKKIIKFIINEINKNNFIKKLKIEKKLVKLDAIIYFIYLNLVLLFVNLMIIRNISKFLIKI